MYRKTYAEVNLDKLGRNLDKIIETYSGYQYYIGVIKNNAYSHGFYIVNEMIKHGINYLAVATLEEALEVRKINREVPILILEPIDIDYLDIAVNNQLTIMIDNKDYFDKVVDTNLNLKYHLKLDVGMNRFGLKNKDDVNYIVNKRSNLILEGIYSHLPTGNPNFMEYHQEINKFLELTSDIDLSKIKIVHLDRSLTLEMHDKLSFVNGCRMGIMMYGYPFNGYFPGLKTKLLNKIKKQEVQSIKPKLKLDPVLSFKTHVLELKEVKRGEIIGYAGMNKADSDETIAILPFGFADFLYDGKHDVLINGKKYPILAVNMDVTIIKVDKHVKVDDEVEIFGENISIKEIANNCGENIYKVLTSLLNRAPRVYLKDNKKEEIKY